MRGSEEQHPRRLKDEHSVQRPDEDEKPPGVGPLAKDIFLSGLLS